MKKLLSVTLLMLVLFFFGASDVDAQFRKIPAAVTEAFKEKFPEAEEVSWRDKLSGFAAEFQVEDSAFVAHFNNKGEWQSTEQQVAEDKLPDIIRDSFSKSKYSDWNPGAITRIELPGDEVQFRLEVAKSDIQKRNLYFSSTGKLLRDKVTL